MLPSKRAPFLDDGARIPQGKDASVKLAALACCCLLAAALQFWVIAASPTPSADTIRYVSLARQMSSEGWLAGLRSSDEHPLYPLLIAAAESVSAQTPPRRAWLDAAQLVSVVLAVAVIPLGFLVSRRLLCEPAAWYTAALLAVWPLLARSGADALADTLQLAAIGVACLFAMRASWTGPLIAGAALGVGSLARAESCVIVVAMGLVELACPMLDADGWRARLSRAAALSGGFAMIPAMLLALSPPTGPADALARALGRPRVDASHAADGQPTLSDPGIPVKERAVSSRFQGLAPALRALVRELGNAGSWLLLPMLVGLFAAVRHIDAADNEQVALRRRTWLVAGLYTALVIAAASRLGYLTVRQVMPALFLLMPWAGLGLLVAWRQSSVLLERLLGSFPRASRFATYGVACTAAVLAVAKSAQPVHASRTNHRRAAEWLAATPETGAVFDTRGWTELYSGRRTYRVDRAGQALRDPQLAFLVVESRELEPTNRRSAGLHAALARGAEEARRFGAGPGPEVRVYRWRPERLAERIPVPPPMRSNRDA